MNQKQLLKHMEKSCEKMLKIARAKNSDYAGKNQNAFANFMAVEGIMSHVSAADGIVVRMCDKLKRVANLLHQDAKVKDESFQDTCLDIANYALILSAMKQPLEPLPVPEEIRNQLLEIDDD